MVGSESSYPLYLGLLVCFSVSSEPSLFLITADEDLRVETFNLAQFCC